MKRERAGGLYRLRAFAVGDRRRTASPKRRPARRPTRATSPPRDRQPAWPTNQRALHQNTARCWTAQFTSPHGALGDEVACVHTAPHWNKDVNTIIPHLGSAISAVLQHPDRPHDAPVPRLQHGGESARHPARRLQEPCPVRPRARRRDHDGDGGGYFTALAAARTPTKVRRRRRQRTPASSSAKGSLQGRRISPCPSRRPIPSARWPAGGLPWLQPDQEPRLAAAWPGGQSPPEDKYAQPTRWLAC